ncbi:MAG TPA: EamA family transporter [Streptosporangiaceae bacterium]|nr:EamA family transporter [Streptosporangiaceae bacterium]
MGGPLVAVLCGLGAAVAWTVSALCASSASQAIGADSTLGWVMLIGLVIVIPPTAVLASPSRLSPAVIGLLAVAGATNVIGLLVEYVAFRRGKVGLVAAIASTEGMVAAVISALAGARLGLTTGLLLGLVTVGVAVAAAGPDADARLREERPAEDADRRRRRVPWGVLAVSTALLFGVCLYTTGRAGQQVPVLWTLVPARVFGSAAVAAPLAARRRFRLTRRALPLVAAAGAAEVLGVLSYAIGARHDLPVAAVLSAQFAALTAVAAYFIHGQRLSRIQVAGLAVVVVGVTLLAAFGA